MAKFNENIITGDKKIIEDAKEKCGIYLQACLSDAELEDLKEDWKEAGAYEVIPYWEYCFNNIKVSYE